MLGTDSPSFTTTCSEDEDGNLIFEIPDELLDLMGWKEGTNLEISALPNSIMLRQVVEPKLQPVDPVDEGEPKPKRKSSSTRTRKKPRV